MIYITECSRDAMQGIKPFIPTDKKIKYIQALVDVNFHSLDCGSFVSPEIIPQMADTHEVLKGLDLTDSKTLISVVVPNVFGAELAMKEEKVKILGFPFSISEKFQLYNTKATRDEGIGRIKEIMQLVNGSEKDLLIYISMGFGNPYGEEWSINMVEDYVARFVDMGIKKIKLSDTIGAAQTPDISLLFKSLLKKYPEVEFGAHFHTIYNEWHAKVLTAYKGGCRRFDGAIQGYGGCPMSKSDMVGNMPTEKLLTFINEQKNMSTIDVVAFEVAFNKALTLFNLPHLA